MRLDIPDILTRFLQLAMLSWGYPGWLWGLAFTAVGSGLSRVARWPYTEECRQPTGLRYKPLTFSWFHGLLPNGTDLRAERLATWWVSPSVSVVVEGPALGLRLEPKVRLGPHPVMVERTGLDPAPVFGEAVTFTTRSSITLSTGQRRADGKLVNRYLSPEQPGFARALAENLRRKAAAFYGHAIPGDLEIQVHPPYRSKLVRIHDTDIRGWMLSFTVSGPPDLIRLGYEAGFGEHTASGFGMVAVARSRWENTPSRGARILEHFARSQASR